MWKKKKKEQAIKKKQEEHGHQLSALKVGADGCGKPMFFMVNKVESASLTFFVARIWAITQIPATTFVNF
jgi:hypothetical protein